MMTEKERQKLQEERASVQKQIDDLKLEGFDKKELLRLLKERDRIDFRLSF